MRLAILSDIHEDHKLLKKTFKKIHRMGSDMNICLGDISGYSDAYYGYPGERDAHASLGLVRAHCEIIIPGNHDLHAAGKIPPRQAGAAYEYWPHEEDLDPNYSEEDLAFLSALPHYAVLPDTDYNILLSHYIDPNLSGNIQGFYSSGKEFASHFELMEQLDCRLGFTGHTHVRGFYTVNPERYRQYRYRRLKLKDFPVVVGIPPVTRNHMRSGFCIFDTKSNLLQVLKL